jgi:hypothetical protein
MPVDSASSPQAIVTPTALRETAPMQAYPAARTKMGEVMSAANAKSGPPSKAGSISGSTCLQTLASTNSDGGAPTAQKKQRTSARRLETATMSLAAMSARSLTTRISDAPMTQRSNNFMPAARSLHALVRRLAQHAYGLLWQLRVPICALQVSVDQLTKVMTCPLVGDVRQKVEFELLAECL